MQESPLLEYLHHQRRHNRETEGHRFWIGCRRFDQQKTRDEGETAVVVKVERLATDGRDVSMSLRVFVYTYVHVYVYVCDNKRETQ